MFCFDAFAVDASAGRVDFHFSHRDARTGVALARFTTAMHVAFPGHSVPRGAAAAALAIGMASLPWLWMGLPTRRILVRAAHLTPAQCAFWTHAYNASLGEFFQLHGLPFPNGIVVECDTTPRPLSPRGAAADGEPLPAASAEAPAGSDASELSEPRQHRVLIPMGGGKDSLTVWELLRGAEGAPECAWFFLADDRGEYEANWRCALLRLLCACFAASLPCAARARFAAIARASGATTPVLTAWHDWRSDAWEAARKRRFQLCAHPWAMLVAFTSSLVALLHGFDAIAVGNERSAGEGNGLYRGVDVNHQYDKSLDFELRAAAYIRTHLSPRVRYFSPLAHLWEVQVAARFCAPPVAARYLRLFTSCNEAASPAALASGAPPSRACGACAKCLFVALLLAAFVEDPRDAWAFAGDDLLANAALMPIFGALLGRGGAAKPFECVGTQREAQLCVARARAAYAAAGLALPRLLAGEAAEADAAEGARHAGMLEASDGEHAVPAWAAAACGADPRRYVGPPE